MAPHSPLHERLEAYAGSQAPAAPSASRPGAAAGQRVKAAEVEYLPYGGGTTGDPCEIVASLGEVELEYAALRRGAGLLDCPQRGLVIVTGPERLDFLDRMLTQRLGDLGGGGGARSSFWLNRKGRVEADLLVVEAGDRTVLSVDRHQAPSVTESLSGYVFTEDVRIEDGSDHTHQIAVHGPRAAQAVAAALPGLGELPPGGAAVLPLTAAGERRVTVARRDQIGETGLELIVEREDAVALWDALLAAPAEARLRPVGWYAYNTARIEAGTPLFNIDFASTNLPHETGLVDDRVSFTKGCYLGQEIVARMQNLGAPKQVVVGLRMERDLLPEAGAPIYERVDDDGVGEPVGVVTSSTLSPMLGAVPVALAMVRGAVAEAGTTVLVHAEGAQTTATVVDRVFWKRGP